MGSIKTRDGINLQYAQTGDEDGPELLFIPGWRQTAALWKKQVAHFTAAGFHVTTYDHRSHGESDKTGYGLRINSLAVDLLELLRQLKLKDVHIVAHSMACSVVWALWDMFPSEARQHIKSIVLVDQSACMIAHPTWTAEQANTVAAIFSPEGIYAIVDNIGAHGPPLLQSMFIGTVEATEMEWISQENQKMSDTDAATLLLDHAANDWRDVLPRIDIPVLVIAAEASVLPAAGVKWLATQMPRASVYTFGADEGGSHFMFWQNPDKFNNLVEDFLRKGSN
jgi:pimeloyl-ACP methyl ester carboxylesterase